MLSASLSYYMFNLGFVIIFVVLGVLTLFMYMPKFTEFKNYRKSRYILGAGFMLMAAYCVFRLFIPQEQNDYMPFWTLIFVSLVFSWLNYTALLYLISADYKAHRSFAIDGISPAILIVVCGLLGHLIPSVQAVMKNMLGVIFLLKCMWLFYTAEKEWQKANRHLAEVGDKSCNIVWMRRLIWLTFLLSIGTLCAWYYPVTHIVYDVVAPLIYFYMVLKLVNYSFENADEMRSSSVIATDNTPPQEAPAPISNNILMLQPKVQAWIDEKRYCRPNITIKDVALEIGTNHNYLSKYLNGYLNVSFQVWLNTLRIEESKKFLALEHISIEEVGAMVGIPLSYNYSRWFKHITGQTPLHYRRNLVKSAPSSE